MEGMAKRNLLIVAAIVVVVVIAGILLSTNMGFNSLVENGVPAGSVTANQNGGTTTPSEAIKTTDSVDVETKTAGGGSSHTIEMSASGFSPSPLTIKKGDTVTFVNVDSGAYWPASAFHPTHTVYPGSDIQKCGSSDADMIFDACGNIGPGDSWSFTFNEVGEWNYHDHSQSGRFGRIVVTN